MIMTFDHLHASTSAELIQNQGGGASNTVAGVIEPDGSESAAPPQVTRGNIPTAGSV